jgi:hypothetical protein
MKNKKIFKDLFYIVLIILLLWMSYSIYTTKNREINRLNQTNSGLFFKTDSVPGKALTLELKEREMNEHYSDLLDSLKNENIKLSDLLRVTTYKVKKQSKDIPVVAKDTSISIKKGDAPRKGKFLSVDSTCIGTSVFSPFDSDTSFVSMYCILDGWLAIHYGKRIRQHYLFGWKNFPIWRTGPKKVEASMVSNCPGTEIYITDIQIDHD